MPTTLNGAVSIDVIAPDQLPSVQLPPEAVRKGEPLLSLAGEIVISNPTSRCPFCVAAATRIGSRYEAPLASRWNCRPKREPKSTSPAPAFRLALIATNDESCEQPSVPLHGLVVAVMVMLVAVMIVVG